MAGPVAAEIRLPDDSGNTGKRVRTQTRDVGSGVLRHEHAFYEIRQAEILGVYRAALAQQTVAAAAQNGTSSGFLWAHVPSAVSNKWARIRRLYFSSQHSTALATPTAPRIVVTRFTFTGTASGAAVTASKVRSDYPSPILDLRTAVTGLTPSLVAATAAAGLAGALTAINAYHPIDINVIDPGESEDEWLVIKPGEGFVLYQDTAGTTSDTRKFNPVLIWDEIDVA